MVGGGGVGVKSGADMLSLSCRISVQLAKSCLLACFTCGEMMHFGRREDLRARDKSATETNYVFSLLNDGGANKFKMSGRLRRDRDSVQRTHKRPRAKHLASPVPQFIDKHFNPVRSNISFRQKSPGFIKG